MLMVRVCRSGILPTVQMQPRSSAFKVDGMRAHHNIDQEGLKINATLIRESSTNPVSARSLP